ncbi:MAG: hypothetical protein GXO50_00485, partial [Chlorobi bacterium]|nr:hypothetical protein [Chlorobiota bacterium]
MKKSVLLLATVILSINIYAQSSIKIYSDLKEETSDFIVYINGEAQDA